MDCGIPFCHQGCPLGNLIPEWNDLTWRGEGRSAIERLHATNNFPEFTGRLCPAPCESSCVLGINQPAVTIKQIEVSIIDEAFANGWVEPEPPGRLTGKTVAVVGSGPAGLAAAQQLTRAGHTVAVFERDDRIGGLLRYGIPDFKMEKRHLEYRLRQMQDEGTRFRAGVDDRHRHLVERSARALRRGRRSRRARPCPANCSIPGRDLAGVHFAMEYLVESNKALAGDSVPNQITAEGKHVVVIGGGDTGADCIGTAHRQGALSVTNLAIGKQPPGTRPEHQPWPMTPTVFEVQSAHEEGGERSYLASTVEFLGNDGGEVRALRVAETEFLDGRRVPKSGTEREIPADLVLIAMGFTGPERTLLEEQLGSAVHRPRQRRTRGRLPDDGPRRLRRRRRRPRPVAHRVGDRRGPRRRSARRPVPDGRDRRCPRRCTRPMSRSACSPRRLAAAVPPPPPRQHHPENNTTMRRAKIVATLGPATSTYEQVRAIIDAGVDVARMNLSHGDYDVHEASFANVRKAADDAGRAVAVLVDLQGPKIRLGKFADGPHDLAVGDIFKITTEDIAGTKEIVSTTFKGLPHDVKPGRLPADRRRQGARRGRRDRRHRRHAPRSSSAVRSRTTRASTCPASPSTCPRCREKDEADLRWGLAHRRRPHRALVRAQRQGRRSASHVIMAEEGRHIPVIAKIEKPQAVDNLEEIIDAFDGIMVARGDLGVELPLEAVPIVQKRAVELCRRMAEAGHRRHADARVDDRQPGSDARRDQRRRQRRPRRRRRGHALGRDERRQVPGRRRRDHGAHRRVHRGARPRAHPRRSPRSRARRAARSRSPRSRSPSSSRRSTSASSPSPATPRAACRGCVRASP